MVSSATLSVAVIASLVFGQPDPGAGNTCYEDINPVPKTCDVGGMQSDPNCPMAPAITVNENCPQVREVDVGSRDKEPDGTGACGYQYYMEVDGECVLSDMISYSWTCKQAGGVACDVSGGGVE